MAIIHIHHESAEITIPADYLEDVRTALAAELVNGSNALRTDQEAVVSESSEVHREDRDAAARLLGNDVRLLDRLLNVGVETTVSAERQTLHGALEAMVRLLSARLVEEAGYAPIDLDAVLGLAERLRWAGEEGNGIYAGCGAEAVA